MTSSAISAVRNLTNISGARRSGKNYFVRPAVAIMSKRYFQYLGYLWEVGAMALLMVVRGVAEAARLLPVPGVDRPAYSINLSRSGQNFSRLILQNIMTGLK
jgi:hypothetical protein